MSDYRKKFVVAPGDKIKLKKTNPAYHGKHESEETALSEIEDQLRDMIKLQALMFAEHKHSLLIVLQGLDSSGKDGVVKHLLTGMNAQGVSVTSFKQPSTEELEHDFLWRIHPHAPRRGSIAIFNRSHYEDVLVGRVHKLVPKDQLAGRYEKINAFEQLLTEENRTTVLKFFLHISKEEQLERFQERLEDETRQWKISESDYSERDLWDEYTDAFEVLLHKTSTKHAPWYVIPSNKKWFRNLAISQIVTRTMNDLGMKRPKPTVDIEAIRKLFHKEQKKRS